MSESLADLQALLQRLPTEGDKPGWIEVSAEQLRREWLETKLSRQLNGLAYALEVISEGCPANLDDIVGTSQLFAVIMQNVRVEIEQTLQNRLLNGAERNAADRLMRTADAFRLRLVTFGEGFKKSTHQIN